MKYLITLFAATAAFSSTHVNCVNQDRGYEVQVDLYEGTADIKFLYQGSVYKEYFKTPYETEHRNILFSSKDKLVYEFEFQNEKATYLIIKRDTYKGHILNSADGEFLPRNNVFWAEANLACSFNPLQI